MQKYESFNFKIELFNSYYCIRLFGVLNNYMQDFNNIIIDQ